MDAEVVGAQVGPAVTMFELTVTQGTRMNKVTALAQEIAATLRARSVRIIAPIPGKNTIGVEVPNKDPRTVRISELVTQEAYDNDVWRCRCSSAWTPRASPIVEDLARAPHMLIAGTTGSGKSVCINTIIAQHHAHALAPRREADPDRPEDGRAVDLPEHPAPGAARSSPT